MTGPWWRCEAAICYVPAECVIERHGVLVTACPRHAAEHERTMNDEAKRGR